MLNKYLELNYNKLKSIAYNITDGVYYQDLLSFVIEELYNCDQEKINEIIAKKQLTFYIARVMVNQSHSKTSRYYYKYKKYYKHHITGVAEGISPDTLEATILEKEEVETKLSWVEEKLKDCYWFDAEVFKLYYAENHSLNSMQKATKISRNTLHKSITNVKNYLKNEKDKSIKSIKKKK
jgi:hypothetical protein